MSIRWRGDAISDRMIIFHDEISRVFLSGDDLACEPGGNLWHFPNGTVVGNASRDSREDFVQFQFSSGTHLTRNGEVSELSNNSLNSGLWTCRLGNDSAHVGIYQRGGPLAILI